MRALASTESFEFIMDSSVEYESPQSYTVLLRGTPFALSRRQCEFNAPNFFTHAFFPPEVRKMSLMFLDFSDTGSRVYEVWSIQIGRRPSFPSSATGSLATT